VPTGMPMGGTLTDRLGDKRKDMVEFEVECKQLCSYLSEKVSFLKLDIEGVEVEVLEECESSLVNVERIFCEFHFGGGLASDRLPRLLSLFDRTGFRYTLSAGHFDVSGKQPFDYLGAAKAGKSLNIHAVRLDID
jgi:hypothetical protein